MRETVSKSFGVGGVDSDTRRLSETKLCARLTDLASIQASRCNSGLTPLLPQSRQDESHA